MNNIINKLKRIAEKIPAIKIEDIRLAYLELQEIIERLENYIVPGNFKNTYTAKEVEAIIKARKEIQDTKSRNRKADKLNPFDNYFINRIERGLKC